ncbi:MAG: hypothetical protein CME61_03390 [Halobacteriovoraceae bacterium]|nr:hypothetical protein [Halobacteriovoraceae bacterium]
MGEPAKKISTENTDYTKVVVSELEILDTFHHLQEEGAKFLLWKIQSDSQERIRVICSIFSSNLVEKEVSFLDLSKNSVALSNFNESDIIFAFSPFKNILFKSSVKKINSSDITLSFPAKISMISAQNVKILLPDLDLPSPNEAPAPENEREEQAEIIDDINEDAAEEEKKPIENLSVESVATETYKENTQDPSSIKDPQSNPENTDTEVKESIHQTTEDSTEGEFEVDQSNKTQEAAHLNENKQTEHDQASIENAHTGEVDFKQVRGAPRGKASGEQVIECVFVSGPKTGERCYYELFDLSMGGLSFIVFDEEEVPKGTKLNITNLAGKEKVPPIKAESVSFAVLDESTGEFKVGVKFI